MAWSSVRVRACVCERACACACARACARGCAWSSVRLRVHSYLKTAISFTTRTTRNNLKIRPMRVVERRLLKDKLEIAPQTPCGKNIVNDLTSCPNNTLHIDIFSYT
eukprot:5401328-Pleurochrysis_carterae.AAC.1